jgi:hypothetical protein
MTCLYGKSRACLTLALFCLFLAAAGGTVGVPPPQRADSPQASALQEELPRTEPGLPPGLSQKQRRDLLKANFEQTKRDADELAALAKSLQEDLAKSNENVLSLHIVEKAEKIEKLAKKIKSTARGY